MSNIVVHDQIGARKPVRSFVLDWNEGVPCKVRDLIAERVRYEHERLHAPTAGLSANDVVNLPNHFGRETTDPDEAARRALAAFEKNGFVLFADGRQMGDLDETIALLPETNVTFIRLIPLKGG
jgi:hypothetical protein